MQSERFIIKRGTREIYRQRVREQKTKREREKEGWEGREKTREEGREREAIDQSTVSLKVPGGGWDGELNCGLR